AHDDGWRRCALEVVNDLCEDYKVLISDLKAAGVDGFYKDFPQFVATIQKAERLSDQMRSTGAAFKARTDQLLTSMNRGIEEVERHMKQISKEIKQSERDGSRRLAELDKRRVGEVKEDAQLLQEALESSEQLKETLARM